MSRTAGPFISLQDVEWSLALPFSYFDLIRPIASEGSQRADVRRSAHPTIPRRLTSGPSAIAMSSGNRMCDLLSWRTEGAFAYVRGRGDRRTDEGSARERAV